MLQRLITLIMRLFCSSKSNCHLDICFLPIVLWLCTSEEVLLCFFYNFTFCRIILELCFLQDEHWKSFSTIGTLLYTNIIQTSKNKILSVSSITHFLNSLKFSSIKFPWVFLKKKFYFTCVCLSHLSETHRVTWNALVILKIAQHQLKFLKLLLLDFDS